jgi:hypothetical protein
MTTIQIELTDATAHAAKAAGLLTKDSLETLFQQALKRREIADRLLDLADRTEAAGVSPLSMDEIAAEVTAVRREQKQRAGGH